MLVLSLCVCETRLPVTLNQKEAKPFVLALKLITALQPDSYTNISSIDFLASIQKERKRDLYLAVLVIISLHPVHSKRR